MKNKPAIIAFMLLLIFISVSVWLVFEYVSTERKRDVESWQGRLSIMAESQQHDVERWISHQTQILKTLANNPLLQLYASQQVLNANDETSRGQLHHLKNLLVATADRSGVFTPISKISGNVESDSLDGIAVINTSGVQLATRYFPKQHEYIKQAVQQVLNNNQVYVSSIQDFTSINSTPINGDSLPRLIIALPVSPVQSLSLNTVEAVVVAVINPQDSLYRLLAKQWVTIHTEESLLVAMNDVDDRSQVMDFLSPLKSGFQLFHQQGWNGKLTEDDSVEPIAEIYSAQNIGQLEQGLDYRGIAVLATARKIRNSNMVLVQKIDRDEALAESSIHQQFILTVFLLAVFIVTVSFIAIWRHATSLHLQKATRRLKARAELLNAIGDSVNDHTFLLDHKNKLVFINDALAKSLGIENTDIRGKALNHLFSNDVCDALLKMRSGRENENIKNEEMRLAFDGKRHDYHVSVVTLTHPDYKQSQLYVMHDITELKDAQGKHNRLMDGIISTLAQVIDKHDPHCAHHSERTREVAVAIARAMDLSKKRVDSLSMAALLANIGKLYIPAEILTRSEPLTDDESLVLRESTTYSVDILKDLRFEGPVIEFVQQKNERLDGSGYPKGLSGEEIHLESKILSVANAFVAMTSSRAYRSGMPVKDVMDVLLAEADSQYDRHVIAALFHVAENHADWVNWQQVS